MKTSLFAALIAVCLVQSALSLTCTKGFYDPGTPGTVRCTQCAVYATQCSTTSLTLHSRIKGYNTNAAGFPLNWCVGGYYNDAKGTCQATCKDGCAVCTFDYDFCTQCHSGYAWNPDYTCLPSIIGLEAASLAVLVIALVFSIIGCCYVNKARK